MIITLSGCVGRALLKAGLNAVTLGIGGEILDEVWDTWRQQANAEQRRSELEALAKMSGKQAQQFADQAIAEMAGDLPDEVKRQLKQFLSQTPAAIRSSLRRSSDPTGTTVSPDLAPRSSADLQALLPERMPRFKPGDQPLAGVPWVLEELIGVGGFGEVWRAGNPSVPGLKVALKFCLDEQARERLLKHEATVIAQVQQHGKHLGMVELRQAYLSNEPPCLEYEYIDGGELTDWLESRSLPAAKVNELVLTLAKTVGLFHRLDPAIVHRDLKPANILVQKRPEGKVLLKIADFGIGGVFSAKKKPTGKTRLTVLANAYSQLYAPPQQRAGMRPDPRDDVYSLGVLWYQLLVGNLAAEPPTGRGWHKRLVEQGVAEGVLDLLESCIEADAADRPKDAAELADSLSLVLQGDSATGIPVRAPVVQRAISENRIAPGDPPLLQPAKRAPRRMRRDVFTDANLPLRGRQNTNRVPLFTLALGGCCAVLLLGLVIVGAVAFWPSGDATGGKQIAEAPTNKKTPKAGDADNSKKIALPKKDGPEKVTVKDKITKAKDAQPKKDNGQPKQKEVKKQPPIVPDVPIKPAGDEVRKAGQYRIGAGRGLLVQLDPLSKKCQQVNVMQPVNTGSRLVSLPGFQSVVDTDKGIRLTLWGLQQEQVSFSNPFLLESVAELHHHDVLDLDMHLHRGRVVISNQNAGPVHIRIRFDNPTNPHLPGTWDIVLKETGTEIIAERWTQFPRYEPYFPEPNHNNRKGPIAQAHLLVAKGKLAFKDRVLMRELSAPPGNAYVYWDSVRNTLPPNLIEKLPDWADGEGKLSDEVKPKERKNIIAVKTNMRKTTAKLADKLASSSPAVVLASFVESQNFYEIRLGMRCLGAIDDLPALVDALDDENPKRGFARRESVTILKRWLSYKRDNAYRVRNVLNRIHSKIEAEDIMTLLHSFSGTDIYDVRTYKTLVHRLNSPKIAIRELAGRQLLYDLQQYFKKPVGLEIPYDPGAPQQSRITAQKAWMKLIEEGKLPPKSNQTK